jgi:hypothetical protein
MEFFLAGPDTPLDTALNELGQSDVMLLVIGFYAGSLIPDGSGLTYTSAEYERAKHDKKPILAFVKTSRKKWVNKEIDPVKISALNRFKEEVESERQRTTFTTPDSLALAVIQSLDEWESKGRPGARRTFVSPSEFFESKPSTSSSPILDFSTTLRGRATQIDLLNSFLNTTSQSVCLLIGRGGIGKSKLLHDWSGTIDLTRVVFLKEEAVWHQDSYKEIPSGPAIVVVDNAHRAAYVGNTVQLFRELRSRQDLKLVLSTRPGGISRLDQIIYRFLDDADVLRLPDLERLSPEDAEALAEEVLGHDFRVHAKALAEVAGDTPLVIVAGGRSIASQRVNPGDLTNLEGFRNTVFNRFLDELKLEGPQFRINPPLLVLELISALGPVDVESELFLSSAERFLNRTRHDILSTLDELACNGVISRRGDPIRILPDVLSDFILEKACIGSQRRNTRYIDKIFDEFGDHFFADLMRNLSELDWRLERSGYGLDLLNNVWQKIFTNFRSADASERHKYLEDLSPAAVYQPDRILKLVDLALNEPIIEPDKGSVGRFSVGQDYVMRAIPSLLEAAAYHPAHICKSSEILWELAIGEPSNSDSNGARRVLKRLTSYQLYKSAVFNFAMLLQCVRLCGRPDAFEHEFTPLDILDEIMEREGEWSDTQGYSVTLGGFGLNYAAVAPVRQSALSFLEFLLAAEQCGVAVRAAHSLSSLLHGHLNRFGRESSKDELAWQNSERLQVLAIFERRLERMPLTLPVRRDIYHGVRSVTGVNSGDEIVESARELLSSVERDADFLVFDAICTGDADLPIESTEDPAGSWQSQREAQLKEARTALVSKVAVPSAQATALLSYIKLAHSCKVDLRGFSQFVYFLAPNAAALLIALVDCISGDTQSESLVGELSTVLGALHSTLPKEFHVRARRILQEGSIQRVRAAAGALRVHADNATQEDVLSIGSFLGFPDPWVKRNALHAVAYMGKNHALRAALLDAVLSVEIGGDQHVATSFVDVFGLYGIPLLNLAPSDASSILGKLLPIDDLDAAQGKIPRFLSELAVIFPEQVLEFLFIRIETERVNRSRGDWNYRAMGSTYGQVSFGGVDHSKKPWLVSQCLTRCLQSASSEDAYVKLFWATGSLDDVTLGLLGESASKADDSQMPNICLLIQRGPGQLAFSRPDFARTILGQLSGSNKQRVLEAFVNNIFSLGSGPFAGSPEEMFENRRTRIGEALSRFPKDDDLQPLSKAVEQALAGC